MSKNLVIVESPAKSKTIAKFLGEDYVIEASYGHVRDLPEHTLGVDIKNDFEPKYALMADKKKIIQTLKKQAKTAEIIYLATDPDREGEAIAWHVQNAIEAPAKKIKRIVFNEITENAIKNAITHSRDVNMDLVDAQQARRILDRLIGYKLSPILSSKIRRGLSAGRVQSVAVKLICDREKEILAFIPKEYWLIDVTLQNKEKKQIVSRLYASPNSDTSIEISTESQAKDIESHLKSATFSIDQINKKQTNRYPQPPFITSTLQQEAARKLNWTAKKTMMIAQQLYEGVDIKGEHIGLITYMRTDSIRVSDEAVGQVKGVISSIYGNDYVNHATAKSSAKKGVQDAHEAIRPSYLSKSPDQLKSALGTDQLKLYKLIWDRFIASQMKPALIDNTQIIVKAAGSINYYLKTTGFVVLFDGFLKVYEEGNDDENANAEESKLPQLNEGESLTSKKIDTEQKFTNPPRRYTEASLVKEMEEKGIGRPSTYAPTISTIVDRGYIQRDKKSLIPTELGMIVDEQLNKYFDNIVDVTFTAAMETKLDGIAEHHQPWKELVKEFYTPFETKLGQAKEQMEKVNTDKPTDEKCPNCGHDMVIKTGRFGEFMACTNYPECKTTKSMVSEVGINCPECSQPIIEKKTRKGKVFYGCSGFPKCKFATWDKPVAEPCTTCNYPVTVQKSGKTICIKCNPPAPPKKFEKKAKKE
jgi:DNA topoisomerase-1